MNDFKETDEQEYFSSVAALIREAEYPLRSVPVDALRNTSTIMTWTCEVAYIAYFLSNSVEFNRFLSEIIASASTTPLEQRDEIWHDDVQRIVARELVDNWYQWHMPRSVLAQTGRPAMQWLYWYRYLRV